MQPQPLKHVMIVQIPGSTTKAKKNQIQIQATWEREDYIKTEFPNLFSS